MDELAEIIKGESKSFVKHVLETDRVFQIVDEEAGEKGKEFPEFVDEISQKISDNLPSLETVEDFLMHITNELPKYFTRDEHKETVATETALLTTQDVLQVNPDLAYSIEPNRIFDEYPLLEEETARLFSSQGQTWGYTKGDFQPGIGQELKYGQIASRFNLQGAPGVGGATTQARRVQDEHINPLRGQIAELRDQVQAFRKERSHLATNITSGKNIRDRQASEIDGVDGDVAKEIKQEIKEDIDVARKSLRSKQFELQKIRIKEDLVIDGHEGVVRADKDGAHVNVYDAGKKEEPQRYHYNQFGNMTHSRTVAEDGTTTSVHYGRKGGESYVRGITVRDSDGNVLMKGVQPEVALARDDIGQYSDMIQSAMRGRTALYKDDLENMLKRIEKQEGFTVAKEDRASYRKAIGDIAKGREANGVMGEDRPVLKVFATMNRPDDAAASLAAANIRETEAAFDQIAKGLAGVREGGDYRSDPGGSSGGRYRG